MYEPVLGHLVSALLTNATSTLDVHVHERERVWLLQGSVAFPSAVEAFVQFFKDQAAAGLEQAPTTLVALKALSPVSATLVSPALAQAVCRLLDAPALNGSPRKLSRNHVRVTICSHGTGTLASLPVPQWQPSSSPVPCRALPPLPALLFKLI
jgi:hypothetical protein